MAEERGDWTRYAADGNGDGSGYPGGEDLYYNSATGESKLRAALALIITCSKLPCSPEPTTRRRAKKLKSAVVSAERFPNTNRTANFSKQNDLSTCFGF